MTVWGYEYTENDDYYTHIGDFVASAMAQFDEKMQAVMLLPDEQKANVIRFTIMVTYQMLDSITFVVLTEQQKTTILLATQWCRGLTIKHSGNAENPELLIKFVDRDMSDVIQWISQLSK